MPRSKLLVLAVFGFALAALTACTTGVSATSIPMFPTRNLGSPPPTFNPGIVTTPGATLAPTQPPFGVATATPNNYGWNPVVNTREGGYWRTMAFANSTGQTVNVLVARFDPAAFSIRVHYYAGQAPTIQQWKQVLPTAVAILNANFFTPQNQALGLLVADGNTLSGYLQRTDSGILQVKNNQPQVRSLWLEPLVAGEPLQQAVQTYPILMALGQVAPINADVAQVSAARSVIAQDRQGRMYFMVTGGAGTRLADLGAWLGRSGLDLYMALNLDGGNSVNMYMSSGGVIDYVTGLRGIPAVIAVYPR